MIYAIVMLVITLKIQLSIIGGYLYNDPSSISTEMQEEYLLLCQVFLKTGIPKLKDIMELEVIDSIFVLWFFKYDFTVFKINVFYNVIYFHSISQSASNTQIVNILLLLRLVVNFNPQTWWDVGSLF